MNPSKTTNESSRKTTKKRIEKESNTRIKKEPEKKQKTFTKLVNEKKEESLKQEKITPKNFFSSLLFLRMIFVFLVLCVAVLGYLIYQKEENEKKHPFANMTVTMLEKDADFEFGIDSLALSQEKKKVYTIKVTNYRDNKLPEEEKPYHITIVNETSVKISLTKGESSKDLIQTQELTEITEEKLSTTEKEDIYYYVTLTSYDEAKSDEFIYIRITNKED